jgi:Raf kinase inhibitor-like YbhB/YbcL family protein
MFTLLCDSYPADTVIPVKFAFHKVTGGRNISPGFTWKDPPLTTRSFALAIVDPHPVAKNWVHWLVLNIPFRFRSLPEGASRTEAMPPGSTELRNSFGERGYGGPAPPAGSGSHPYVATLFALRVEELELPLDTPLSRFLRTIDGSVIAEASVTGTFER